MRVLNSILILASLVAGLWGAPQAATVGVDALTLHSKTSAESPARGSLQRGDAVVINMVLQTNRGTWCDITKAREGAKPAISGYVECSQLEQQAVDDISRKVAATPADPDAAIDTALRLSGFTEEAAGLAREVDASVTRAIAGDRLTPQQRTDIVGVVKRAMTPAKLTAAVKARLKAGYSPDTFATVLAQLRLPISEEMTQLGVHENLQSAGTGVAEAFVAQISKSPPSRSRLALIERIIQASGSSGVILEFITGMMRGMMSGLGASPDQVEVELTRAVKTLPPELKNSNLERISLVYSYRSATDAELAQYAEVLDTPAVRWFNGAVRQGFVDFAEQSGAEAVKNFGIKVPLR